MGRGLEEARSRACPVLCAVRPSVTRPARQHPRDPAPSPGAAQRFAADALATQRSARPRSTRYWRERPIVTQNAALRGCSGSGVTSAAFVAALRWSAQAAGGTRGRAGPIRAPARPPARRAGPGTAAPGPRAPTRPTGSERPRVLPARAPARARLTLQALLLHSGGPALRHGAGGRALRPAGRGQARAGAERPEAAGREPEDECGAGERDGVGPGPRLTDARRPTPGK